MMPGRARACHPPSFRGEHHPQRVLARRPGAGVAGLALLAQHQVAALAVVAHPGGEPGQALGVIAAEQPDGVVRVQDRKSTRLNSSHVRISYAVFCLKKKKINTTTRLTSVNSVTPL